MPEKLFASLGNILIFNRKHKRVRRGVVFGVTNLLLFAGLIFLLEVIVIFLGLSDIYLPLTGAAREFLASLIFF